MFLYAASVILDAEKDEKPVSGLRTETGSSPLRAGQERNNAMPKEWKYDPGSMLKTVESMQKVIKDKEFDALSDERKRELYASFFAARYAANAEQGKKKTLKTAANLQDWTKKRNELVLSPSFQAFVSKQGHENLKKLLTTGHGGVAEKAFQDYVMEQSKLPTDVPERYMPTAEERIDRQKQQLAGLDPRSDEAILVFSELFRTRRAVDAVRKKGSTLKVKVNGEKYAETENLAENKVFADFVRKHGGALRSEAETGHGGAAEDLFKDYLLKLDHIPEGAPKAYMPTALDHLEYLKTQIKSGGTPVEQRVRYTEIMATREAVQAVRGKSSSLEPQLNPALLDSAYDKWNKCETFQSFLKEKPEAAEAAATAGHGGKLQDEFRSWVLDLDHIPADVPEGYMPDALERLEAIQEKYKAADYKQKAPEEKLALAAELMATREVVHAVRKDADSLKKPIKPDELNAAVERWKNCKAFQDFVKDNPDQIRSAATAGHGGLLGDKFKEYVLSRELLDDDIPYEFMPNASARLEVLKKKIQDSPNAAPEQKQKLYAEMLATRSAVEAIRGKEKSLYKPIDPAVLKQERDKLLQSETFKRFLSDPNFSAAARNASQEGHGGALEDSFKEYVLSLDTLPADVPSRWMPSALERTEALQEKIKAPGFAEKENAEEIYIELMAARDAVNAKRGDKDSLSGTIDPESLASAREKWKSCESFKTFLNDPDSGARKAALSGHGGALGDKFKEYVTQMEILPEDIPERLRPTAEERIDALKDNLKKTDPLFTEDDEYKSLYAQLLAARAFVGAKRKDKDSLKKPLDPAAVNGIANQLTGCKAFGDFLKKNEELARKSAVEGHGGEFADQFREYVRTMNRLPADVPTHFMPTAMERIEGLQDKIDSKDFKAAGLDAKVTIYAELLGARRAVGAERKNKDSLKVNVPAEDAKKAADSLINCSAFREFIEKQPDAARNAASSGHGGALEDAFKEYVLHMDRIPQDVPKEYMPTALERTEVLQKKIESKEFKGKAIPGQNAIYKELAATRTAAESVRGDKKSLNTVIDAKQLNKHRLALSNGEGPDLFFDNANRKELKDAALSGHGGAMEDLIKKDVLRQTAEMGRLPKECPERYRPTAAEARDAIKKNLADKKKFPPDRIDQEQMKKQVAGMMYLTKLEKSAAAQGGTCPAPDPQEMQTQVNKLLGSQAFKDLFKDEQTIRRTRENAAAGKLSNLFQDLGQNEARIRQEEQQRRLREQQRQQQQQAQNQNQQPNVQEQPNPVQRPNIPLNEQEQPVRRRANSLHQQPNPERQL